jgi:hypothetical protein
MFRVHEGGIVASDYGPDGARIGKDGASTITWQAACDTSVTDWVKTDEVIFSANAASGSHTPDLESFKLQWRNKSDSGAFADLVTGSGELRAGTSAGCITNGDPVNSTDGCGQGTMTDSEEIENESPLATASLDGATKYDHVEIQGCVDFTNALKCSGWQGVRLSTILCNNVICTWRVHTDHHYLH